ncbi:translation machinery-associated protein 20 [Coemansia spiralis]|uniref:Translation machinery-associated protein 20 n=2 Tax=Coemansia TaxID=4863 RepID=A0A9W8G5K3_9FUNG|nr:malignant T cell amplified sequence 1-like protein [Coemansia spiralis]KAJ1989148.1 translation machinery-associated protein 20 [Coemansia umbellata]KAJ2620105.1 translation machinery-associated protein 20 [Coemansia sp. RSA 1358]KAJ2672776.1 translation machinery-associated protein 20 [Coemansia spiralis]
MFKKFSLQETLSGQNPVKSSVVRGIRTKLCTSYPGIEPHIDLILPKKSNLVQLKCKDHITLFAVDNEIVFFQHFDLLVPTLTLLHSFPDILPRVQVDRGAIKFVLSGANIMCPGLTSPGAWLPEELAEDVVVAVMAEGKETALAVGVTKMTAKEMREVNKGIGVDLLQYLGDPLWKTQL